jgi:PAS domain S-box-containing protein
MGQLSLAAPGAPALREWNGNSVHGILLRAFLPFFLVFVFLDSWVDAAFAPTQKLNPAVWYSLKALAAGALIVITITWIARRTGSEIERTQKALTESEARYRSLFENMLSGYTHCRMLFKDGKPEDFIYLDVNDAFEKLTGLKDVAGKKVSEVIPGVQESNPELFEIYGRVARSGQPERFETHIDSLGIWFSISVNSPRPDYFVAVFDNITERKHAENLVQARMRLMEFAATHSLGEILQESLDEVGKITNSPIGFYHFVEADQQTLSLQTWSTRTLQEFCTAQGKGLHYNVSDAGVWVDCIHQRRPVIHNDYASLPNRKGLPEGHAQVIRELVVPILRGDRIVSILGVGNKPSNYTEKDVELVSYLADVAWEIADRKRAEEEIASLSKFPTENPNPILRAQNDGRITYANAASQELLELWGCEIDSYLPAELNELIDAAAATGSGTTVNVPCNDKVYSIMLVPIVEAGYVNLYGRDITERKRAEETLARQAEELRRSNAELEQFAYVASHDLQEPLRMISSYLQLLARRYQGKLDSDADEFIAFAVDGAKRMKNLINDLLMYSRVGTRGRPLTPASSEDVLKEAVANLQFMIEESGTQIIHEPMPVIHGDPIQLVMVFQNLLGNAIKFRGSEEPCIHIGVRQDAGEWIFSVRDNGIGIDPKFAERIFVIFQRLNDRTAYPGTGIGLAICKRVIQRHGGRIWVQSRPGEGATFYFTVPVKETV